MTQNPSAQIELTETDETRWLTYLRSFQEHVYTLVFQPFGFTLPEAFIAWQLNRINNSVGDVEVAITGEDERD